MSWNARRTPSAVSVSPDGRPFHEREQREAERHDAERRQRDSDADRFGDAAEHRTEDRAGDRCSERDSNDLATLLPRGDTGDPREGSCPRDRAGEALNEAGNAKRDRAVGECEREACDAEKDKAPDDGALRAEACRSEASGYAAEERACAEGRDQESRPRLRKLELVRVPGHERRQRGVQHRVDEDDRAEESQQPAHSGETSHHEEMHRAGDVFVRQPD